MTHLCYTLEEAAETLNLSETVLVRLSQSFRVPNHAYEEAGYLSFKGDLTFSDQDIAFFRQVKERLLAGETLDEVKSRIRHNDPADLAVPVQNTAQPAYEPPPATFQQAIAQEQQRPVQPYAGYAAAPSALPVYPQASAASEPRIPAPPVESAYEPEPPRSAAKAARRPVGLSRLRDLLIEEDDETELLARPAMQAQPAVPSVMSQADMTPDTEIYRPAADNRPPLPPFNTQDSEGFQQAADMPEAPADLIEIEDRTPFEKAAERSFNRYKNTHHSGLGKVFEKMMNNITPPKPAPKREKFPVSKPLKSPVTPTPDLAPSEETPAVAMFIEDIDSAAQLPFRSSRSPVTEADAPWRSVLNHASQQPRALNTNLKTAAMLLRQRALAAEAYPENTHWALHQK